MKFREACCVELGALVKVETKRIDKYFCKSLSKKEQSSDQDLKVNRSHRNLVKVVTQNECLCSFHFMHFHQRSRTSSLLAAAQHLLGGEWTRAEIAHLIEPCALPLYLVTKWLHPIRVYIRDNPVSRINALPN